MRIRSYCLTCTFHCSGLIQAFVDGTECGDPSLGLCQQSECIDDECVFSPVQTNQSCLCGVCVDCDEAPDPQNCGGNCQYLGNQVNLDLNNNTFTAKPPSSLLLSVPCQYDNLTISVANCDNQITYFRNPEGYFNISKPRDDPSCAGGTRLNPRVIFEGGEFSYGDPPYNCTNSPECLRDDPFNTTTCACCIYDEFCQINGQWEIHSSCSYPLYIGQTFGPQSDIIMGGYCTDVSRNEFSFSKIFAVIYAHLHIFSPNTFILN